MALMSKRTVNGILVVLAVALAAALFWGRHERARLHGELTAQAQTLEAYRVARRNLCRELWARTTATGTEIQRLPDPNAMVEARVMMNDGAYFGRHCANLAHAALVTIQSGARSGANPSKAELDQAITDVPTPFGEAHDLDFPLVTPTEPAP